MKKRLLTIFGIVLMAAALFTVIHFIWSDLYIAEFDADNAETVIWAEATLESGRLADPDFHDYYVLIPVGGNLFFIPFVKAFGVGITALRAGYTVLAVIFAALLVLALRALQPSWDLAMIGAGLIMFCTTATETLRDILWGHTVYYGVTVFCILMCIGSLALYLRGKRAVGGILFFLSALFGSINGSAVLLFTVLPLTAAVLLESMNRERPSEGFMKGPILLLGGAIVCGVALNKCITSGIPTPHADLYTQLAPAPQWGENLRLLPERWLSLFFKLPTENVPAMSSAGIKLVLRLGTALVLSVMPFVSFFMPRESKPRLTRIVILYHWILCAVLLFFFIFGKISDYNHRLIPLWFSCLIVDWLTMVWMMKEKGYPRLAGIVSVCLTVLFAGMTAVSVTRQPADLSVWYGNESIYHVLESNGLTHGYSTHYWFTNSVTVLSESRIKTLGVTVTEDGFEPAGYQNKNAWFKETPTEEKTFLVCQEWVVYQHPRLEDEAVEVLRSTQYTPHNGETDGFYILVYDHDIIAENLRESASVNADTSEN